jgi:hypothetical protein
MSVGLHTSLRKRKEAREAAAKMKRHEGEAHRERHGSMDYRRGRVRRESEAGECPGGA